MDVFTRCASEARQAQQDGGDDIYMDTCSQQRSKAFKFSDTSFIPHFLIFSNKIQIEDRLHMSDREDDGSAPRCPEENINSMLFVKS